MTRSRWWLPALVCVLLGALAPTASASTQFRPRVANGLGLVPPVLSQGTFTIPQGTLQTPEMYHAGNVMAGGITIHTIFWAPAGFAFQGQPAGAPADYEGMIEQFLTDVAHDSGHVGGTASNVFSNLPQFAMGTSPGGITAGSYSIAYNAASSSDLIIDTHAYPAAQCTSPQSATVCLTDAQVQSEVDRVITAVGGSRGLHDLWYVFTPPDVDECINPGVCETTAYAGYHSLSNLGHGVTIYAYTGDPIVETRRVNNPGNDPQGYPDAELVIDVVAHETDEAMTDPEGVGWMDPNGFEVGDKCEFGPQFGTPLGFAADGSPYNQVINGHQYLIQEMWANADTAGNPNCVQSTQTTSNQLPLPQVNLTQFSSTVTGNTENNTAGIHVTVSVVRAVPDGSAVTVASGSTTTASDGSWSVSLGSSHAVGDDRDEIDVDYSGTGAPSPSHQVILTGNGGNPFLEAGWTGWFDLDNGYILTNNDPTTSGPSLTMGPCFQEGVLTATLNSAAVPSSGTVTDFCGTSSDAADVAMPRALTKGDVVTNSTNDNRAYQPFFAGTPNPNGGLVSLTITDGEPDAFSSFLNPLGFAPTGFPTCTADLEMQSVTCTGLVPSENYALVGTHGNALATADATGTISSSLTVKAGDVVALTNGARTLTTLHVANLRVDISGGSPSTSGGTCQAGDYYGPGLTSPPLSAFAGGATAIVGGSALTGEICPMSGSASGLPTATIAQTDDLSGGMTQTEVPAVQDTSPIEAETVYGTFTALAETGLPGPGGAVIPTDSTTTVALSIAPRAGGAPVFTASNVDTANGVNVSGLAPGSYTATWTLTDASGDTRTATSRFIEQSALQGPPGPPGKRGPRGPRGPSGPKPIVHCKLLRSGKIKCTVSFPKHHRRTHGTLRMSIARGGHVFALGHGAVRQGSATLTLRGRRRITAGRVTVTLVLAQPHAAPVTMRFTLQLS